ncbi:RimJ/RimL family protein N-acetyltransferase [Arthrobacter stackebrandtii]|uniref:RimJ/RimL family protein N-acetyltransferase n=1 Tax=Arthrobacter stackebrandtii TaxID=272161 RepID=A0ABS4YR87_9MICC|nr:RimJ/RimL family protein N-acetyltransferase [Arthrobacter stackebrandtii]
MSGTGPSRSHPVLSDGQTTLRRFTAADASAFASIHTDPLNITWTASDPAMTVREAGELIAGSIARGWEDGRYLRFAITDMLDGVPAIVGTLSLQDVFSTAGGGSAGVGIKMLPAGRGTGAAQRAIALLCGYAFGNLGLEILHWRTTAGNEASASLARRCGFVLAAEIPGYGHVDGTVADGLMFTLTRDGYHLFDGLPAGSGALDLTPAVPVLAGDRVVLRALSMADAPALVENCRNPEAVRWTAVPLDYSMADADFFINKLTVEGWRTGRTLIFAAARADTDELLGTIDLQCKAPGAAAVGINFGPHARGTGAAEEAVRLLLDYAFDQLNLAWVHWIAMVPNWASRKLAWKLGFHYDGHGRGDYDDRGKPADRWLLSLAAGEPRTPVQPWTGPVPRSG